MHLSDTFTRQRTLQTLVENQTSFTLRNAAMHVFETHRQADRVFLQFDEIVLASMIRGKKVMHLRNLQSFEFLPGESLMLPRSEIMCIDFPEATPTNPTQCLAMTISGEKVKETVALLNEYAPKADGEEWKFTGCNFHFSNDAAISQILDRLLFLFTENHPSKDVFADFMIKELIIRILQTESRKIYSDQLAAPIHNNRLAFIIQYIREHLSEPLTIEELSQKAYMSESHFYKVFKNELGISPVDFINNERIKLAAGLLHNPDIKIKEIYMICGFNSLSYFNRMFKRAKLLSPSEYRLNILKNSSKL